jgi:hypothetical protein
VRQLSERRIFERRVATRSADGIYRSYARGAAAAFALVAVYTLLRKAPNGELARDWMHTVLHVGTGSLAAYAGWIAGRAAAARALTIGLVVVYGALGVVGWFTDGLVMGSPLRIPLETADNVFHLLLALAAAFTVALAASTLGTRR